MYIRKFPNEIDRFNDNHSVKQLTIELQPLNIFYGIKFKYPRIIVSGNHLTNACLYKPFSWIGQQGEKSS